MSLYANINKRKEAGTSRSKKDSTISDKAYSNMQKGFPKVIELEWIRHVMKDAVDYVTM